MKKSNKKVKIILKGSVRKLGSIGSVVNVRKGYSRYLEKYNFALKYSTEQHEIIKERIQHKDYATEEKIGREHFNKLDKQILIFERQASGTDILYSSVNNKNISEKIFLEHNIQIDRRKIMINTPIKKIGIYTVELDIFNDLCATISVVVARTTKDAQGLLKKSKESDESTAELNVSKESSKSAVESKKDSAELDVSNDTKKEQE